METLISRINKTVQVGADEKTRKVQASKAYAVSGEVDPSKTYLLVDDVWTTGASMESAIRLMKKAGAYKLASAVILMPPE